MHRNNSGVTVVIIALTNAVPLVGLFALDWTPGMFAFLLWFEAAVIGLATFMKVAASLPDHIHDPGPSVTYRRLPRPGGRASVTSTVPRIIPLLALPQFLLFYGLLLFAYGALLLGSLKDPDYPRLLATALASDSMRLAMALIVGEHLWAFWREFVRAPAWQRADPTFHFWRPFGLVIVTWLAFLFGFVVLGWLQSPLVVLTVLILLKAIAEIFGALVDAQTGVWTRAGVEGHPARQ